MTNARICRPVFLLLAGLTAFNAAQAAYDFEFFCRTDTIQRISLGGIAEFYFTIRNTGTEPDYYEFNCRVVQGVPNWFVMYCVGGLCALPGAPLYESLNTGEADTLVHLTVIPHTTGGEEIVSLSVRSTGDPTQAESAATRTICNAGIAETGLSAIAETRLSVQPNPTTQQAVISYFVPDAVLGRILALYDSRGRQVQQYSLTKPRGRIRWSRPAGLPAGIYFLHLDCGDRTFRQKLVIRE